MSAETEEPRVVGIHEVVVAVEDANQVAALYEDLFGLKFDLGWDMPDENMRVKGGYVLVMELEKGREISVGSLGRSYFPAGFYAYCGSALAGFKARLNRHLTENKKPKWHIDYLVQEAEIREIILCQIEKRLECLLSQALGGELTYIPHFGCSDCHCKSHLFFSTDKDSLVETIIASITKLGLSSQNYPAGSFMPEHVSRQA